MAETRQCPECGTELSAKERLRDLCPRCLLLLGLGADPGTGMSVGEFDILQELGRGGMGVVYKAYQPSLNRVVALKVLSETLAGDAAFVKRFQNEAMAAAQLNHAHVVAIYTVGSHDGSYYIAMEYVDGLSLSTLIDEQGRLEVADALGIARQVLQALAAAHDLGIIHRDIKPQNILVDSAGRVRVLDFGLARLPAEAASRLTEARGVLGTLAYMAPEQCRGEESDRRTDLYAVGAVLYQMLTGRLPFQGRTPAALVQALLNDPVPDPRRLRSDLPEPVVHIVQRALAKNPADRYGSAAEMESDIQRCMGMADGSPNGARFAFLSKKNAAESVAGPAVRGRRIRTVAAMVAAVALVIIGIVAGNYIAKREGKPAGVGDLPPAGALKLKAGDPGVFDVLGHSVAIDGDIIVLGALRDDDRGSDSGSAYVFERKRRTWSPTAKLTASDAAPGQWFGYSVAVAGRTAVMGAYKDCERGRWSGAAYVFERSNGEWKQSAKLMASDASPEDWFGFSVAIQGHTVVVGAIRRGEPGEKTGAVYIFQREGQRWLERARLAAERAEAGDYFGYSVAIDANEVAAGAVNQRKAVGHPKSGVVVVFRDTSPAGDWSRPVATSLAADDGAEGDWFGGAVALGGGVLVVGAPRHDSRGPDSGATYVFGKTGSEWIRQAKLTPEDGAAEDAFGTAVAVGGDVVLATAVLNDFPNADCGVVYGFCRSGRRWVNAARLIATDPDVGDRFGTDVALAGTLVLVGAPLDDERGKDSGAAYVIDIGNVAVPPAELSQPGSER